jgi:hypothetical protein
MGVYITFRSFFDTYTEVNVMISILGDFQQSSAKNWRCSCKLYYDHIFCIKVLDKNRQFF